MRQVFDAPDQVLVGGVVRVDDRRPVLCPVVDDDIDL